MRSVKVICWSYFHVDRIVFRRTASPVVDSVAKAEGIKSSTAKQMQLLIDLITDHSKLKSIIGLVKYSIQADVSKFIAVIFLQTIVIVYTVYIFQLNTNKIMEKRDRLKFIMCYYSAHKTNTIHIIG